MRSITRRSAMAGIGAAALTLGRSKNAYAKEYDVGVTDTEIKLGTTSPYSGPASAYGVYGRAQSAYFEMVNDRVSRGERVLVTTLTKKMAEDLTDYLLEMGVRVRYLHSEVDTIERIAQRPVPHEFVARRPGDPVATYADPGRIATTLGWKSTKTLDDIVTTAWQWHSTHPTGYEGGDASQPTGTS